MPIEDEGTIKYILKSARTIAVVGASDKRWRDSNDIMRFLLRHHYSVFPVNPSLEKVLDIPCYKSLKDIKETIDIVDVFRKSDAVPAIVDDALAVGAKTLWLQLGVIHEEAAHRAENGGLRVIMNHCIAVDHRRLIR